MAEKIITILGVTGMQGASVATVFLKEGGWHVRGITRDPSKPAAKEWTAKGVEVVAADLNDVASLTMAFAGSTVIYGVTDFWGQMGNPKVQESAKQSGRPVNVEVYNLEIQQGHNLVDAANATVNTLQRFVLSTLADTKKWSKGKYVHNYHFDSKWTAVDYLNAAYPELAKKTSYLQVGYYMTNWATMGTGSPTKQPDGTYVLTMPIDGDAKIPMVDARLDTGKFTKALIQVAPGKNLLGFGSMISFKEFAAIWGRVHGVKCSFQQIDRMSIEAAMPGGLGEETMDMFDFIAEFGYDGGDPSVVHPKDLGVEIPVCTCEEYIKTEDWSSIL
ncbi:NAD(P)-binding protein [Cadophora sp. DSE1049]|nr:NAD(P)-binding protein [Cadophora sp. DSE1049]